MKAKLLDTVVSIIKEYPAAANDDAILLEQVWTRQGWDESQSLFYNLKRVSRPESISRRRREAYNLGLIEYSEKALKTRDEAFKKERAKTLWPW